MYLDARHWLLRCQCVLVGHIMVNAAAKADMTTADDITVDQTSLKTQLPAMAATSTSTTTGSVSALSDEPRLSSAALSITLQHLGHSFRPEFTHQIVEKEVWPGYQPLQSILDAEMKKWKESNVAANDDGDLSNSGDGLKEAPLLHTSHQSHDQATHQLDIQIQLSPSCESCQVKIQKHRKGLLAERPQPPLVSSDPNTSSSSSEPNAKRPKTEQKTVEEVPNDPIQDSEILSAVEKALPVIKKEEHPEIITANKDEGYLAEPIGEVLEEYSVSSSSSSSFVLTVSDGRLSSRACRFHANVQRLALWYIENADHVDIGDQSKGGHWKVVYLFQKHQSETAGNCQYSLAGYMTLYHFISLFHKPEGGIIVRICQALLLPPYQGQGHGGQIIRAIYSKLARQGDKGQNQNDNDSPYKIVQINVEDPAPAFVALRNKTDYNYVMENISEWREDWPAAWFPAFCSLGTQSAEDAFCRRTVLFDENFFSTLSEVDLLLASALSKLTTRQIQIVHELYVLQEIQSFKAKLEENGNNNGDKDFQKLKDDVQKKFRLMVKRRFNKEHREELGSLPSKDNQKAFLAQLYESLFKQYERILKKKAC